MNYKFKSYFFLAFVTIFLYGFYSFKPIDPKKEKKLLQIITSELQKNHYNPIDLDDWFSKAVFKNYINSLDPNRNIFLKSDIEEFQKFETKIDNFVKSQDLSFFYMTHDRLKIRLKECKTIYTELLKPTSDFTSNEFVNVDFANEDYAKNTNELKEKWKKIIKFQVLDTLVKKLKLDQNSQTNPKFIKNFDLLEQQSRKNILKKLNSDESNFELLDRDFYFNKYLNAIISEYDPHSKYYSQTEKDEFDQRISGKNIGLGMKFLVFNNFLEVKEVVFGGPAWKSKKIDIGDVLLKIANGNEPEIDVIGFGLDDINKLIKGKLGTSIKFTIKKRNGSIKTISIKREIVEYKESYVKSCIVERYNEKIGIIDLPKFYKDIENEGQKDAAKDVAIEIENLKKFDVNGIILDLRDNGGGLVETAVEIAGMFIPTGPIVQIKSSEEKKEILADNKEGVLWDGSLIVMINKNSASATEIFAAAMQDYNRALIVGGQQTYGKGTVQNTFDLNQFNAKKDEDSFGALKLTIKKYYRINGFGTQIKGVASDIVMPDKYSYSNFGEKSEYNVLPWDKINEVQFKKINPINFFASVIENSKKRIAADLNFRMIDEQAKLKSSQKDLTNVSLNFEKNKLIQNKINIEFKKFDVLNDYKNFLIFKSTDQELSLIKNDIALDIKRNDWHQLLSKDIYIDESLNIISDMIKVATQKIAISEPPVVKTETKKTKVKTKK